MLEKLALDMTRMPLLRLIVLSLLVSTAGSALAQGLPLNFIRLPPGFRIELWTRLDNPRAMALGADDTVFVGSRDAGRVYAVKFDRRMRAVQTFVVAQGLDWPVGVAFRDGALYVSAIHRILRLDGIEQRLASPPAPVVANDRLPRESHHGWKFIAFGPDGKLYVPVG